VKNNNFSSFLANLTEEPGIYQMLDDQASVIYVGKAKNLRKRVSSYFQKQSQGSKTRALVEKIRDIKIIVTKSEVEALLLECELIKKESPKYNILLRDDKSYPFIFISTKHPFPRLIFYRGKRRADGRIFGPFPSVGAVKETISFLQKIFKLRTCRDSYFKNRTRPCLEYQIKRCQAPCVGFISEEDYQKEVKLTLDFLCGKSDAIIQLLENKMMKASEGKAYEKAASVRDQIQQLRHIQADQTLSSDAISADVLGLQIESQTACLVVLVIREGKLIRTEAYYPKLPSIQIEACEEEVMHAFITQYYLYQAENMPREIITPYLKESALELLLSETKKTPCRILTKPRGMKAKWLVLANNNASVILKNHLISKASMEGRFEALERVLNLDKPLQKMECFDISHTGGSETVGSCVVFNREGPLKKDYRQFNIKDIKQSDDYAAIEQVVHRRYERLLKESRPLPDLILIDGGKGQVNKAKDALRALGLDTLTVLGVSKGPSRRPGLETMLLEKEGREFTLEEDSKALHLIQYIRDESHRFAVQSHRQKREKKGVTSILERIEGVGEKRRRALLHYFGGMKRLLTASSEEIEKVPGISREMAQKIAAYLVSFR
jgi:excinuclease ABC subunit C